MELDLNSFFSLRFPDTVHDGDSHFCHPHTPTHLRHTCATLMLQANVPIKVVQERLGHKNIEITLGIYAHALPSMQQEAAVKLGAMLHG